MHPPIIRQRNRSNWLGCSSKIDDQLPRFLPWFNGLDRCNMGYGGDGCHLVYRDIFQLWLINSSDSDLIPAFLSKEHPTKSFLSGRYDHSVNLCFFLRGRCLSLLARSPPAPWFFRGLCMLLSV